LQGDPTVVDPNNDGSDPLSITTYNYTISTTGNGGCDAFEFSDTITIIPSETITRNGIADDDAVVGIQTSLGRILRLFVLETL
jgi:hypothetical protein